MNTEGGAFRFAVMGFGLRIAGLLLTGFGLVFPDGRLGSRNCADDPGRVATGCCIVRVLAGSLSGLCLELSTSAGGLAGPSRDGIGTGSCLGRLLPLVRARKRASRSWKEASLAAGRG